MPFIPVPLTVEAEMRMRCEGQRVENTLYFHKVSGWNVAGATDLANELLTWWTAQYAPQLSSNLSLNEIAITDLSSATGFSHEQAAPVPNPTGGSIDDNLPLNVALAVSFRTSNRGRSFRGRNYITGIPISQVSGSLVDGPFIASLQDAYEALIGIASGLDASWSVVSRFHDNAPRTTGIATHITSAIIVDNVVDSQRRRLPGRGL